MITTISDQAVNYIKSNISVIPVSMPSKRPVKSWKEYQSNIISENVLLSELDQLNSSGGIALVCGKVSGNLEILDFDNKFNLAEHTFTNFLKFPEVAKIIGKHNLPYEKSLSGGYHLLYRCESISGNKKLAQITKNDVKETIVETRGEGGYCIVAPTQGYTLLHGRIEVINIITKAERDILFQCARTFSEFKENVWSEIKLGRHKEAVPPEAIKTILERAGWTLVGSNGRNENYRRPGKKFGTSASYDGSVFYVFSTNCQPFEAEKGYNNFQVFTLLKHGGNIKDAEKELVRKGLLSENETIDNLDNFFIVRKVTKGGEFTFETDSGKFLLFLNDNSFFRFDRDNSYIIVHVQNKIVEEVAIHNIIDFCIRHVEKSSYDKEDKEKIISILMDRDWKYFTEKKLGFLRPFRQKFNHDNKTTAFFYFKDAFVEITNTGIDIKNYSELSGCIWKNQIINRNINFNQENEESDFKRFLQKITRFTDSENRRYFALTTAIGYVLHRYKNAGLTKAIILCDEGDVANLDPDSSQGGTGKSLVCKAISKIRNTAYMAGKSFNFEKNFLWQKVNEDTELIWIDDVNKRFKFENLFPYITGDFEIEQKNKPSFVIPFERAPKFIIPTNFTIAEQDVSTKRRIHEVELAPIYNEKHQPIDDFGKLFFDDWNEKDWFDFDSFMINCVADYLETGLVQYEKVNLDLRKLLQSVPTEFLEWIDDYLKDLQPDLEGKLRFRLSDFFNSFVEKEGKNIKFPTQSSSTRWLFQYLNHYNYNYYRSKVDGKNGVVIENYKK
jgi:hypothetical protein